MKVLITGAAGFIGSALSLALLRRGFDVYGIDNFNDYYSVELKHARIRNIQQYSARASVLHGNFACIEADCLDADNIGRIIPLSDIDLIVHLAAQPGVAASAQDPRPYLRNNITAFCSMLELARESDKPLLMASSSTVYGEYMDQHGQLDRIDVPMSVYGATKSSNEILARAYCRNYGMSVTAMRFFSIYGPWGRPDMFYYIIANKLLRGESITVYGDGSILRDMTFIDDAIHAIGILVDGGDWKTPGFTAWDVGFQNQISVNDMIRSIADHVGLAPAISYEAGREYDMHQTRACRQHPDFLDKVESLPPEQGLKIFVDWLVEYSRTSTIHPTTG